MYGHQYFGAIQSQNLPRWILLAFQKSQTITLVDKDAKMNKNCRSTPVTLENNKKQTENFQSWKGYFLYFPWKN